jgi:hypothetical protein
MIYFAQNRALGSPKVHALPQSSPWEIPNLSYKRKMAFLSYAHEWEAAGTRINPFYRNAATKKSTEYSLRNKKGR